MNESTVTSDNNRQVADDSRANPLATINPEETTLGDLLKFFMAMKVAHFWALVVVIMGLYFGSLWIALQVGQNNRTSPIPSPTEDPMVSINVNGSDDTKTTEVLEALKNAVAGSGFSVWSSNTFRDLNPTKGGGFRADVYGHTSNNATLAGSNKLKAIVKDVLATVGMHNKPVNGDMMTSDNEADYVIDIYLE